MRIGTLTIKASQPMAIDGLSLGQSPVTTKRFAITTEGFERKGQIIKTKDYQSVLDLLGHNGWQIESFSVSFLTKGLQ